MSDLQVINAQVRQCKKCNISSLCKSPVPGVGTVGAKLCIVGEAPGVDEDFLGIPFVGRAGQELQTELWDAGFRDPEEFFVTNIVKCRPPNNRDPRPQEIANCNPWLDLQLESVDPKAILCVGRVAANTLLKTKLTMGQLRTYGGSYLSIPVFTIYHPSWILRDNQQHRGRSIEDLRKVRAFLEETNETHSNLSREVP